MNSLASRCTEDANSTDCLPRTLLDFLEDARRKDDGKYEWDPITFGFTVSIALAAAGFALITIIQAVLAAGPARRKSNREAIGKWAKKTKWQWQWWDFGYLYVAQTPILSVENITASLEKREATTPPQTAVTREPQTPLATENETENEKDQRIQHQKGTGASWLNFLEMTGLADLELGDEAIITTVADYLPSDLVAVPAPIEVRLVFLLIALSQKPLWLLEPESRCPSLTSPGFQFELRQHANMGLIGAFSSYKTMSFDLGKLSTDDLNLAAKHADGVLLISNRFTSGDSKTAYETPDSPHKYERNEKLKELTGRFASQETFAEFEAVTQPMLENVKSLVDARNEAANQPMLIFGRGADVIIRGRRYAWEVEQEESPAVPFFIDTLNNRRGVASGADVTCPEYKTHKETH
ncbi:hypothetical protein AUP68_16863 [Ilyonectria robusta]